MIQQRVQELLTAWREAERELERTDDPRRIEELEAQITELRTGYQEATASTTATEDDSRLEPA